MITPSIDRSQDILYQGFTPNTPLEQARARFLARYGKPPARIIQTAGGLLVGPIEAAGEAIPDKLQLELFKDMG